MENEAVGGSGRALESFGAYRVLGLLGAGGMGVVYLAEHDGRRVALKVLPEWARGVDRLVHRFHREMTLHASCSHPNVVGVIACGMKPAPHLVLEPVLGGDLARLLRGRPRGLPPRSALAIARGISSALAALHARGIVHRDVTPENVLLGADGSVKLTDFGVAFEPGVDLSEERHATGKLGYAAPDPLLGAPPSAADDVYSLGVVLWEMLVGAPLVPRGDAVLALDHILEGQPPPPSARVGVSAAVDRLVLSMLRRDRDARPSAAMLTSELAALAIARPTSSAPRTRRGAARLVS